MDYCSRCSATTPLNEKLCSRCIQYIYNVKIKKMNEKKAYIKAYGIGQYKKRRELYKEK